MALYVSLAVAFFSALAWFSAIGLVRIFPARGRSLWIAASALLPTMMIVIGLVVWDRFEWHEYLKGPRDGYMSPLVGLIYGFPLVLINLICNTAAAVWSGKRLP